MRAEYVELNDGNRMPTFGLGTFRSRKNKCSDAVQYACNVCHYSMIDTARGYKNETYVALGIFATATPREKVFLITKVPREAMSYEGALESCEQSLQALDMNFIPRGTTPRYIDLLLLHWPGGKLANPRSPTHRKRRHEAWRALIELKASGRVRSIGVSNFTVEHLQDLREAFPENIPAVNQVEVHPYLTQQPLRKYCEANGIHVMAYTSMGRNLEPPALVYGNREPDHKRIVQDPVVQEIAKRHDMTPAQVCLLWALDSGMSVIPKAVKPVHILENSRVRDMPPLSSECLSALNGLNEDLHYAWDATGVL